ncbi:MAG TPA: hypothetical protein VE964_03950 [Myxococcales bacterium]|nr:hypothetical protein [Myxococcales bacterium]
MTNCDQLRSRALALAALPPGDPDGDAAAAHARSCPGCAQALREGTRLLKVIDTELRPSPPPEAALQRAQDAVLAEMDREDRARAVPNWRSRLIFAASVLLAFGTLSALSRHRAMDAESWIVAGAAAVLAALLAGLSNTGLSVALGVNAASAALVLLAGAGTGVSALVGIKCMAIELFAATWPFAAAALSRGMAARPSAAGPAAALAAAGALAGQASLHLTCPDAHALPHLLVFHLGGVVLASLAGALVLRARPA